MGKELDGSRLAEQLDLRAAFLLANAGRTYSCDYGPAVAVSPQLLPDASD